MEKQRVEPFEVTALRRDSDDGQGGTCRERTCEMRRHASDGDDGTEPVLASGCGKSRGFDGRSVRGVDMHFKRHLIGGEGIERFPRDGQVAVAPHNDGDFFHGFHSFHAVRVGRVFHARAAQK